MLKYFHYSQLKIVNILSESQTYIYMNGVGVDNKGVGWGVAGLSGGKKCLFLKTEDLAIKPEDRRI